jgi:hypothetical protein
VHLVRGDAGCSQPALHRLLHFPRRRDEFLHLAPSAALVQQDAQHPRTNGQDSRHFAPALILPESLKFSHPLVCPHPLAPAPESSKLSLPLVVFAPSLRVTARWTRNVAARSTRRNVTARYGRGRAVTRYGAFNAL